MSGTYTLPGVLLSGDHASRPAASAVADGTLYAETDTGQTYQSDGASAWTAWGAAGGGGLANEGTFTYLDGVGAAAPGNPAATNGRLYAKTDGRFYSRDNSGTEYGPFDAAGGATYVIDDTFPGSSLPSGWAFTGSGTCNVTGGVAQFRGGAQSDRLLKAITPASRYLLEAHVQSVSGFGGMPALVVLDSSGNGFGAFRYNDLNSYFGISASYAYTGYYANVPSAPTLADTWMGIYVVNGRILASYLSDDDGVTWAAWLGGMTATSYTMTQFGIVQLFSSANISLDIVEMRMRVL